MSPVLSFVDNHISMKNAIFASTASGSAIALGSVVVNPVTIDPYLQMYALVAASIASTLSIVVLIVKWVRGDK